MTDLFGINEDSRVLAYNMDLLHPGIYVWCGVIKIRIGGYLPDDSPDRYPGVLNSRIGVAIVFPGQRILTTHRGTFDNHSSHS